MAPSRKAKGKKHVSEASNQDLEDQNVDVEPSLKSRRLNFNFTNRSLTPYKYGNLATFPSHSFDFHDLFEFQGISELIGEFGNVYPDLVKDFYANLSVASGGILSSVVKGKEILLILEDFGNCLGIPFSGELLHQGVTPDWEGYDKWGYFFSISRLTEEEILSKKSAPPKRLILFSANLTVSDRLLHYLIVYILLPKHSNHSQISDTEIQLIYAIKNCIQVNWAYVIMYHMVHQKGLVGGLPYGRLVSRILEYCGVSVKREPTSEMTARNSEINLKVAIKNMGIVRGSDGIYKYMDQVSSANEASGSASASALVSYPVPEGGYTNEAIYNKMCSIENLITTRFQNLRLELFAEIRKSNPNPPEEMEEDNN